MLTCSGSFGQPRLSLADLTHCVPIFDSTTRASPGDSFLPLMSCDDWRQSGVNLKRSRETHPADGAGGDEEDEQNENASEADKPKCGAQSRSHAGHRRFPTMARLSRDVRYKLEHLVDRGAEDQRTSCGVHPASFLTP